MCVVEAAPVSAEREALERSEAAGFGGGGGVLQEAPAGVAGREPAGQGLRACLRCSGFLSGRLSVCGEQGVCQRESVQTDSGGCLSWLLHPGTHTPVCFRELLWFAGGVDTL